jgi:hypothetical protein
LRAGGFGSASNARVTITKEGVAKTAVTERNTFREPIPQVFGHQSGGDVILEFGFSMGQKGDRWTCLVNQPTRRLRFEPLELRRVLSITVDTLVDENNGVGTGAGTSLRGQSRRGGWRHDRLSVTGTINLSVGASELYQATDDQ